MDKTLKTYDMTYSFKDVIGMLIGPEAGLAVYILISTYLLSYYTDVIGLNIAICSTLILVSKIFDGVSDVIFGFILDKTKSKLGPCRAWTLRICVPYALMTVLLFTVPGNTGVWPYVYVFVTYNLMLTICYTVGDLSENTLPTYITRDPKGRALLMTIKGLSAGITAYIMSNNTLKWVEALGGGKNAWIKLAAIVAAVSIVTKCIMVLLTKERVNMDALTGGAKPSFKSILKAVAKNKYWIMVTILLCAGRAIQTATAGTAVYYGKYVLGEPAKIGTILSAFLLPPIAGFLMAGLLMQKFSRKSLIVAGLIIGTAGILVSGTMSSNFTMLLVGLGMRGFAYSIMMGVGNTMSADTVEYGHWKTGVRTQGVLMSGKGVADKLSAGLVTGIIGWVMGAAGYDGTKAVQPEAAVTVINNLFLWLPLAFMVIILICIWKYDLDKLYPQIVSELSERVSAGSEPQQEKN